MKCLMRYLLLCGVVSLLSNQGWAEEDAAVEESETAAKVKKESPWMLVPTFSSDPKVGTSLGAMAGYLFKNDPESTSSMAGISASYSNTESYVGAAFLRSYWDADSKRLAAVVAGGNIKNDYSDYLGSGLPASTTDEMKAFFVRYTQEWLPNWFFGGQMMYSNYTIVGDTVELEEILQLKGLTGFDSGGIGLVAMFDDRDNQNSPSSGTRFVAHNIAHREAFGGDVDFDTYNMDFRQYFPHGKGNVFAYHVYGRWSDDAPESAYSSVYTKGYTRGQYLAPYSTAIELEERWRWKERISLTLYAAVTCLYGDGEHCGEGANLYPSAAVGGQYVLKMEEKMVISMNYAKGEGENSGFYIQFGQSF